MPKRQISDLLAQLQGDEAYTRNDAIKKIIKEKIDDEQIIVALKDTIENDPNMAVRNFARSALDVFGIEHSEVEESVTVDIKVSDATITQTNNEIADSKVKYWYLYGFLMGLFPIVLWLFITQYEIGQSIFLGFPGILGGLFGASKGNSIMNVWIRTIVGTLIASFLWFIILVCYWWFILGGTIT